MPILQIYVTWILYYLNLKINDYDHDVDNNSFCLEC